MTRYCKYFLFQELVVLLLLISESCSRRSSRFRYTGRTTANPYTKTVCMQLDSTRRARHKACFLRPDTGPCRADIVQWYYDVKQSKCYRFFWGGCQGNGNRFDSKESCNDYCFLNSTNPPLQIPYYCQLSFDFGTCFGHFNRWAWDKYSKTCKRRLYSGCGGNQNNFESQLECRRTCLTPPNNTLLSARQFTTCVPYDLPELA